VFEFAEEALDEVTLAVDGWIDCSLDLAVALGGDMGLPTTPANQIDQVLPVITAIGHDDGGDGQLLQECGRCSLVGSLTRCKGDANR